MFEHCETSIGAIEAAEIDVRQEREARERADAAQQELEAERSVPVTTEVTDETV